MKFVYFYLLSLLIAFKTESMAMNPNEIYDNLHDDFEKSMPISLVVCSDHARRGDFGSAAAELYNFSEAFKNVFSSDFTKFDSKESIEKSLRIYCESIVDTYKYGKQYNQAYPARDFIWYSLCGKLYFSYEGMVSQITYIYESIREKSGTVRAREYVLPTVQLLYKEVNHDIYRTFSDFCNQTLSCLRID